MKQFLDQLPAVVIVLLATLMALGVSMVVIFVLTAVEWRSRWNEHFTPSKIDRPLAYSLWPPDATMLSTSHQRPTTSQE